MKPFGRFCAAIVLPGLAAGAIGAPQVEPVIELSRPCGGVTADDISLAALGEGGLVIHAWGEGNLSLTPAPDATPSLRVRYPAGSRAPSVRGAPLGGAGFYLPLEGGQNASAACLRYRVFFPETFAFTRGGKLPGLYGGPTPAPAGGARPLDDDGFSLRLMWRGQGAGELYLYAPNMVASSSGAGMHLDPGAWQFARGRWTDVALKVRMNTPGRDDGIARLWIDGRMVINVGGIRYRNTPTIGVAGMMFSTFFGGKSARFGPPTDQQAFFSGFALKSAEADSAPRTR